MQISRIKKPHSEVSTEKLSGEEQLRIGSLELLMHKQVSENCQDTGEQRKKVGQNVKDKWEEKYRTRK
jgi:hypothetical protein